MVSAARVLSLCVPGISFTHWRYKIAFSGPVPDLLLSVRAFGKSQPLHFERSNLIFNFQQLSNVTITITHLLSYHPSKKENKSEPNLFFKYSCIVTALKSPNNHRRAEVRLIPFQAIRFLLSGVVPGKNRYIISMSKLK